MECVNIMQIWQYNVQVWKLPLAVWADQTRWGPIPRVEEWLVSGFASFRSRVRHLISPISLDISHQVIITWPLGAVFFYVSDVSLTFPVKRKETC